MRTMEFTIENTEALKPGMEVNVTEGVLPSSYYYTIEHALGMSANFKQAERLKTRRGVVKELKETPQFHIAVLEFDEGQKDQARTLSCTGLIYLKLNVIV